ncbi:hypothetical protein TNCV_1223921 [Trichonephila clavipes]|nr:hypothetical protein TNCV_1223921 [Trichonephila clavipes]
MMEKGADLSESDRGQIVMAQRLGANISKTVQLVGSLQSALFSICLKCINDGETNNRSKAVASPLSIKEKGRR